MGKNFINFSNVVDLHQATCHGEAKRFSSSLEKNSAHCRNIAHNIKQLYIQVSLTLTVSEPTDPLAQQEIHHNF